MKKMENNRNSDVWKAASKALETQVAVFLQNGLAQRFEQFDQLLKSPDFDMERQIARIKVQVGNYEVTNDGLLNTNPNAIEDIKGDDISGGGNTVQGESATPAAVADVDNSVPVSEVETGSGNGGAGDQTKTAKKRKLVDEQVGTLNEPPSQPKQVHSSSIITKQAGVAIPLIRSVLDDLNLLKMQLNMMMAGPTQLIEMMDKTYFKGRLSTALESFDESKEIAENIDLDMYNYHVKRAKLIKELGKHPSATPDILLSVVHLDTDLFRRIHQILTQFRNSYYLALTMDHILSTSTEKMEEANYANNNAQNQEADIYI